MKTNSILKSSRITKILLISVFLFYFSSLFTSLSAQISLSLKNATIGQAMESIKKQTDYHFFYDDRIASMKVDQVEINNKSLKETLQILLKEKNVNYSIKDGVVYLSLTSSKNSKEEDGHKKIIPQKKIIKGVVSDIDGEPLIGTHVMIKGSSKGTVTNVLGEYEINVPSSETELVFSYVGYSPQTILVKNQSKIDVLLAEDSKIMKEVVVTALGIKREKKMLGYAIQDLKSDELNKTGDPSITGALQGKVAGLQMNTSSTGLNGSTKITLRGNSSLTDNNQPLWVVDGIPFNDNNNSNASLYGGVDRGGATVDINPEDIESISVLKGPNAAALYGSRAGNGVILVTTKKGTRDNGFGVSYNGSVTWTEVASTLDMQEKYGQGVSGAYNPNSWYSYGGQLDGHDYTGWNGETMKYDKFGTKLKDYFRTGFSQTHNIAIGNVTEKANYRLSIGNTRTDGLFNKESLEKTNIDIKSGMKMNKYLSLDSKVSLSRTEAENRPVYGKGGEIYQLLFMPNNIRLDDIKTYRDDTRRHINWVGPNPTVLNPYYVNYSNTNADERWRSFGYASMKINFTDWLYGTVKYAFDYYHTNIEDIYRTNGISSQEGESYNSKEDNFFEQNMEAMLLGNNKITDKLQLGYSLGVNEMYQKTHYLLGKSKNMKNPGFWHHNSAQGLNAAEQGLTQRKTRSVFGTMQLAWNDYLALDLTARNDWSSTLPIDNCSYFYPSVNLSFVFSDFIKKQWRKQPSWLTFGKIRLSTAKVGKDTSPYQLINTERWTQTESGPVLLAPDALANKRLKPEMSSSYEGGLDMRFFNNRLGFDFTYYLSLTENQIMRIPMAATSGYSWQWINAGEIENKGFEFMLFATPLRTKDWEINLNVNIAHNVSTVKKLDEDAKDMSFNFRKDNLLVDVGAYEGGKLGDIFGLKAYKKDKNGNIITRNGLPLLIENVNPRVNKPIGNIQPDLLMSFSPSISYKGIALSALFDMKFGGNVVSVSEAIATSFGTAKRTENRGNFVIEGVDETTQTENTIPVSAEEYYQTIGGENGIAEEFIYDASFIRLKELSLSYSLPRSILKGTFLRGVRFSVVGRNLAYLLKHTPGTSPEGGFDTTMFSQAIDFTSVPYTRTIGGSLSINF